MPRAPALLPVAALLASCVLLAPPAAASCFRVVRGPFEIDPTTADAPTPPLPWLAAVRVIRQSPDRRHLCGDPASMRLELRGEWADAFGYRLAVVGGEAPPGMGLTRQPYTAEGGAFTVGWGDSLHDRQRIYDFALAVIAVDHAGRRNLLTVAHITVGAPPPPRPPRRRRSALPIVWLAGFSGLFALGRVIGWLRAPRIGWG